MFASRFCLAQDSLFQPRVEVVKTDSLLNAYVVIDTILFEGNKRTQPRILTRELGFKEHDTIPLLLFVGKLENGRKNLMNTQLFNEVEVKVVSWTTEHVDVKVVVRERWYVIPVPIFELADRNFNVWWTEQNRDFRRTVYGVTINHVNFRGLH